MGTCGLGSSVWACLPAGCSGVPFRPTASRSCDPHLACQRAPWEQPAAGFGVPVFSQKALGGAHLLPWLTKMAQVPGGGSPLPGRAPCPYRIQKGRRWRSSPDFRTQPIGRGAGFSVLSDTCFFFFLNDSHYGILNFLWGWRGMAGKHSPHLFGFILPSQL